MAIIAYVPAYHRGYAEFFGKHPGPIFVLSNDFVRELYPQIERDVRALPAADMVKALGALWPEVHLIPDVNQLTGEDFILPDEDVSHLFAKKYLAGKKVTFAPTHLRWDGWATKKESPVPPDRVVSHAELDQQLLKSAQTAADKSPDWWRQVGAVIAKNGKPLFIGYNRQSAADAYNLGAMGDPRSNFDTGERYDLTTAEHAEAHLIGMAAAKGTRLAGTSMYVTTFPCPTCAKLIATAGIKKVYYVEGYSLVDAETTLRAAGISIILVR